MGKLHKKTCSIGRRLMVLLLLCGLLLPIYRQVHAATVVYEYRWIKDVSGLPKDSEWHDYFLAWEDLGDSRKVWFTDYHWYTPDGDSNQGKEERFNRSFTRECLRQESLHHQPKLRGFHVARSDHPTHCGKRHQARLDEAEPRRLHSCDLLGNGHPPLRQH